VSRSLRLRISISILVVVEFIFVCLNGMATNPQKTISQRPDPINVGMVTLLAGPQRYEGKVIRTIGFLDVEFEGNALYLHEEDYHHGILNNSVPLRLTESQEKQFKEFSLKYVLLEGRIDTKGPEVPQWNGAIVDITRLEVWPINRSAH